MEKSLDLLMQSYKSTKLSSRDKYDLTDYELRSQSNCEDGYCITSDCTCEC